MGSIGWEMKWSVYHSLVFVILEFSSKGKSFIYINKDVLMVIMVDSYSDCCIHVRDGFNKFFCMMFWVFGKYKWNCWTMLSINPMKKWSEGGGWNEEEEALDGSRWIPGCG